ncbi:MAG: hypothetical protein APF81_26710 [Desulfosporosinus sp. BRH_c37]|nr:MAG: hypothetical protein APF81_26710 [Desulfosporosinus sp. BRH_c37]
MGRKIFISYKYRDNSVQNLVGKFGNAIVRDYVNILEDLFSNSDHIFKAEHDDEDLSNLSDETIWESLKDRIYDSSLTIVLISPNMKEKGSSENQQWIAQEVSYSLKAISRTNKSSKYITSRENAIIAVVLPDKMGSYSYFINAQSCCSNGCTKYHSDVTFEIIAKNIFNQKVPNIKICADGSKIHYGDYSYIQVVRWSDFISAKEHYLDKACEIQSNLEKYEITKQC